MNQTTQSALHFFDCALDVANARLWRGSEAIRLRPKSLAVLAFLANRPGQLVTKAELLAAVWSETAVTEWVLTSCIKELRQALGDAPQQPRVIETVHRRGYRFIAEIRGAALGGRGSTVTSGTDADLRSLRPSLVGRDGEIAELRTWWQDALGQQRQIGFIAGEPGIGKTTLRRALLDKRAHALCVIVPPPLEWL